MLHLEPGKLQALEAVGIKVQVYSSDGPPGACFYPRRVVVQAFSKRLEAGGKKVTLDNFPVMLGIILKAK